MKRPLVIASDALDGVVSKTVQALRKQGLLSTLRMARTVVGDALYDLRRGIHTVGRARLEDLDVAVPADRQYNDYEAFSARMALSVLRRLDVPKDGAFVDVGCGRGRMLVVALEYGFQRVVGVEISHRLCEDAEQNLRRLHMRTRRGNASVKIINRDALEYVIDDDASVLFLYNPFGIDVLRAVLDGVKASMAKKPRALQIIYVNPMHRVVLDDDPFWVLMQEERVGFTNLVMFGAAA